MAEKNNEEKIPVDKDFLQQVLKSLEDVKEDVNKLKEGGLKTPASPTSVSSQPDHIFQCMKTVSIGDKIPTTPEELAPYQQLSKEFETKLQILMRKYKIIQLTAVFLKKL